MTAEDFAVLFEHSADGLVIAAPDGRLTHVNPAAAEMLSRPTDALRGQWADAAFAAHPALLTLLAAADGDSAQLDLPAERAAYARLVHLPSGSRALLLHDVSAARQLDARREALIHTLAHDLRNPVAAIAGYAGLISVAGDLNEEQSHYLSRINDTALKLHEVAAALADLAWIGANMPIKRLPLQLETTLTQALSDIANTADVKQIALHTTQDSPLPPVIGDPDRLRTALYHLLHNAIRYSEPGTTVEIRLWAGDGSVWCAVSDHGFGLTPEDLERAFDRFFRSEDPRVHALPGGGIGLTLARRIAMQHGGDLTAVSALNEGSTFTVRLPAADA